MERKAKISRVLSIGNATKIGSKPGEKPPTQSVIDPEFADEAHQVSIFRRELNYRQDVHMEIIRKHRNEILKESLKNHLNEKLI